MSINTETCDICQLLPTIPESLVIDENLYWSANLAMQDQSNLGRSYITLKRHASELDDLTEQEEIVFRNIRNGIIRAIRQQFSPITFNISCLKNDAFRSNPDSTLPSAAHVHWHVIPRYDTRAIEFAGETFQDSAPGLYLPAKRERKAVNTNVANKITEAIRSSLTI